MTKALEPDRSAALWYSAGRRAAAEASDAAPSDGKTDPAGPTDRASDLAVEVWLFGLLSAMTTERPVKLTLPAGATTEDVLATLRERFGSEYLAQVEDGSCGLLPHCRVIVNDIAVEDVTAPLVVEGRSATVEMILLKGFEGG